MATAEGTVVETLTSAEFPNHALHRDKGTFESRRSYTVNLLAKDFPG